MACDDVDRYKLHSVTFVEEWVAWAALSASAVRALDALEQAGVPALVVKGVALRATWGARGDQQSDARAMEDADVRIPWSDFEKALVAARAAGFGLREVSHAYRSVVLVVDERMIDVECTIGPPGLCALEVDTMLTRAERVTLPGQGESSRGVRIPELHDHTLVLAVNAFKDKCSLAAPWVKSDLARIVRDARFDAQKFVARVHDAGCVMLVTCVAEWMCDVANDAVWAELHVELAAGLPPAGQAYVRAYRLARAHPGFLGTRVLARVGNDRRGEKARALARLCAYAAESLRERR